ncbi:N-acetylmuramidase family protein [Jiella pelagia]|uniref:N-acetylmuramidase family protein n=1 Tax=Jiella pelagia TaxID=2986949 RepID=A0ABY7BZW0_9HYPH|nr:N-acetylmuramidase family protein [Jiella pelagia]WAP68170.1 N-acetylmuramidase family protein [Jiella pelagia]
MNFVGTGIRLTATDYQDAANFLKTGVAEIRAVVEVEAAGRGFFPDNRPKILFEPHVFYRQLGPGMERDAAVQAGVAYKKWKTKPYPKSANERYQQLATAMNINITMALRSASWGLPQMMGFNYTVCGYAGVISMVEDFKKGERQQLVAMLKFFQSRGIDDDLRAHRWVDFAGPYNGPGQAVFYANKLKAAYEKFSQHALVAVMAVMAVPETAEDEDEAAMA